MLSVSAAARLLGVSPSSLRAWAAAGQVPHVRTSGGHRRFEVDRLVQWLAERGGDPPAPVSRPAELVPTRVDALPAVAEALRARTEDIRAALERGLSAQRPATRSRLARNARITGGLSRLADGLEAGDLGPCYRDSEWEGFRYGAAGQAGDPAVMEALALRTAVDEVVGEDFEDRPAERRCLERALDRMAVRVAAGYAEGVRCRLRSSLDG
jgi:excisionase family DNA binding protein